MRVRFAACPVVLVAVLLLGACASHRADPDSGAVLAPSTLERPGTPVATAPAREPLVPVTPMTMNEIGAGYVKLVLALGELEPDYVDAYYGPAAWQAEAKAKKATAEQIDAGAQQLIAALKNPVADPTPADAALLALRRTYLRNQLGSISARARLRLGLKLSFDDEARALYDVDPPHYRAEDFKPALARLDQRLPKDGGSLSERYNRYVDRYAIPKDRIETVMRAAIAAARQRTLAQIALPVNERFELTLVSDKPWSAYNWYQGNAVSRIEVNTDLPIGIARAIELASHEGYPGHHVYNGLLENGLVRQLGWSEYEVYPLFSPQSLIAEGSADFGVGLAFPGDAKLELVKQLFKLAGFDPREAKRYLDIVDDARRLQPATIEAARAYLDGRADGESTVRWLQAWTLASEARARQRLSFFDRYRAYIVNYSYGEVLVRGWVEKTGGSEAGSPAQWAAFRALLSTPRTPTDLAPDAGVPAVSFPGLAPFGPASVVQVPETPASAVAPVPPAPTPTEPSMSRPLPPVTPPALTLAPSLSSTSATVVADDGGAPLRGKVADLPAFERFIGSRPTPEQFRARYPDVRLVLPGQIATKEFRMDRSRYFATLDGEGRIGGGRFQ